MVTFTWPSSTILPRSSTVRSNCGAATMSFISWVLLSGFVTERHLSLESIRGPSRGGRDSGLQQRGALPFGHRRRIKISDQTLEQPAPVQFRTEPDEHATQSDGGPIHENEFARRLHPAGSFQPGMDLFRDRPPELRVVGFLNAAHPILGQRLVEKASPQVQYAHLLI